MPPSRGCLAIASGTGRQNTLRNTRLVARRQYSALSQLPRLPASRIARCASQRPWLPSPRVHQFAAAATVRPLSLWGWGSGSNKDDFKDLHQVPPPTSTPTSSQPIDSIPSSQAPPVTATATTTSNDPPLDLQQALDAIAATQNPVPVGLIEKIGHFQELGLNFGWGPTSVIQWMLEHVHVYTGTPWWASIMITAAIFRVAMIPLILKQSDVMARMGHVKPELEKAKEDYKTATLNGDSRAAQEARFQLLQVQQAIGGMKWMWLPIVVQLPLGYCTWKFVRTAAELPVPGWADGGFWWISDLTVPDPYYITPVLFAGIMHVIGRLGGETGASAQNPALIPVMRYILPGVTGMVMIFMPTAVQMTFITSMVFGVGQSLLLRNDAFRHWAKLTPLPKPKPEPVPILTIPARVKVAPEYQPPTKTVEVPKPSTKWDEFKKEWTVMRDAATKKMQSTQGQPASSKAHPDKSKEFLERAEAHEKRRKQEEKMKKQGKY